MKINSHISLEMNESSVIIVVLQNKWKLQHVKTAMRMYPNNGLLYLEDKECYHKDTSLLIEDTLNLMRVNPLSKFLFIIDTDDNSYTKAFQEAKILIFHMDYIEKSPNILLVTNRTIVCPDSVSYSPYYSTRSILAMACGDQDYSDMLRVKRLFT